MIILNSIKQMMRTPVRTLLFGILIFISTVLLVLGINLWKLSIDGIRQFEDIFTTIGTVEQKEETTKRTQYWDAGEKEYYYGKESVYGEWVDESVLEFQGADYIVSPRKRPCFGAYMPQYQLHTEKEEESLKYSGNRIIAEITPLEKKKANPVQVEVVRLLEGYEYQIVGKIWLCDHRNPNPITLEEGKTYIAELVRGGTTHDVEHEYEIPFADSEYWIGGGPISSQCTFDGVPLSREDDGEKYRIDEVTEGFYETEKGKAWLAMTKESEMRLDTIPVQAADSTETLMPFHNKQVYIKEGRDITKEEYESGADVCLIPSKFAQYNHLEPGDTVELPLYYADYRYPPVMGGGLPLLNKNKHIYPVFDNDIYEVAGIYEVDIYDFTQYGIAENEIIIPFNSVTGDWSNNIIDSGPMRGHTTSFQIKNGKVEEFMRHWKEQGIENLDIKFYDSGYQSVKEGIENRKMMAYIFLAGGTSTVILILLFFCHLFIVKQEQRTAVERSLGMSRKQCMVSMLTPLLLTVVLSALAGGAAGYLSTGKAVTQTRQQEYYNDMYTNGIISQEDEEEGVKHQERLEAGELMSGIDGKDAYAKGAAAAVCIVIAASVMISGEYMRRSLSKEPLNLLSCTQE